MFRLDRILLISLLALIATATTAQAQDDDYYDCPGCTFVLNGPNGGGNGQPNPCGTDQRVTIMGFNGACKWDRGEDDDDDGGCVEESPCFAGVQVEYRSNCPSTAGWEYGPLGTPGVTVPLPPTPGGFWVELPPILETLPCGSPMYILLLEIEDVTGYHTFSSAQFRCTACE